MNGLHPREKIRRVYAYFRRASGGCDGATGFGFNGCLNVSSLFLLFQAIGLRGRNVVDLGAGEGRVLASAMKSGAKTVVGYELPANSAHKFVFDAVLRQIFPGIDFNSTAADVQWLAQDIDQLTRLPEETDVVYSFWNGMPYLTQIHILELSASCQTVRKLVVFRDHKWSTPNEVVKVLNENSPAIEGWVLFRIVNTAMFSSQEKKTAWIFRR